MKTSLTPEQSATLIAKGISADKASMVCMDFNGSYAYVSGEEAQTVRDCVNGQFYVEECRVFTLADICSLLPKEIENGLYSLDLMADNVEWGSVYSSAHEGYNPYVVANEKELIDALYKTLLWTIDHNHVKLD